MEVSLIVGEEIDDGGRVLLPVGPPLPGEAVRFEALVEEDLAELLVAVELGLPLLRLAQGPQKYLRRRGLECFVGDEILGCYGAPEGGAVVFLLRRESLERGGGARAAA